MATIAETAQRPSLSSFLASEWMKFLSPWASARVEAAKLLDCWTLQANLGNSEAKEWHLRGGEARRSPSGSGSFAMCSQLLNGQDCRFRV